MPGEPKPDQGELNVDLPALSSELGSIAEQWDIDDPMERDEMGLRQREEEVAPLLQKLLESDVSAESDPELLAAVKKASSAFDTIPILKVLRQLEAKMEGQDVTQEEIDKIGELPNI